MEPASLLDRTGVVLVQPRDPLNIGGALRATRNMGIDDLRLVDPFNRDPERIAVTAPGLDEAAAALPEYPTLDQAVADGVLVAGFTARQRHARREVWMLDELGDRLGRELPDEGRLYLVFGREDFGLSNEDLDRCHTLVTIPTDPGYASLNLAQAVLLGAWTVRRWAESAPALQTRGEAPELARTSDLERLLDTTEAALEYIEFYKFDGARTAVRRALAGVFNRARLDRREVRTLLGIFNEIKSFCSRMGVPPPDKRI